MSYEGLASRMTKLGCSINASAIYKIEKSDPPRRITVDELVGFSEVFGIGVADLLLPPEVSSRKELVDILVRWDGTRAATLEAQTVEGEAWKELTHYVSTHPEVSEAVEWAMQQWVDFYIEDAQRPGAHSYWMWKVTKSEEWAKRAAEEMNRELESEDG